VPGLPELQPSKDRIILATFEDGRKALAALLADTMRQLWGARLIEKRQRGNRLLDLEPSAGRYRQALAPSTHDHEALCPGPLRIQQRNRCPALLLQRPHAVEQLLVLVREDVELQEAAMLGSITAMKSQRDRPRIPGGSSVLPSFARAKESHSSLTEKI
jgi:hypothetical protein